MKKKIYSLLLMIIMVSSACGSDRVENIAIPKADIIYQAITMIDDVKSSNNLIGFVNADGSGSVQIKLQYYRPYRPLVSKGQDGIFFGGDAGNPVGIYGSNGPIYYLDQNGKYQICQLYYNPFYFPVHGRSSVLIVSQSRIDLLDIETCRIVKNLVKVSVGFPWTKQLGSATPSDSGNKVIFDEIYNTTTPTFRRVIYIIDVDTAKMNEVLEGGFNPSLSPDEKNIAYVGDGGIYIANADGTNRKLLVTISFDPYVNIYPWPFWSPDGTTLVYHKCNKKVCADVSDFSIYKVNVNTGVEVKIVDNGLFPNWIK
jgi:hypothetical protein